MQGEHINQKDFFRLLGLIQFKLPEVQGIYAIPNAGKRGFKQAAMIKAEGLKKGCWDVCVPIARKNYHGLYIEFKYGNNTLTPEQKWFEKFYQDQGYLTKVFKNSEEAFKFVVEYISGKTPVEFGVKFF